MAESKPPLSDDELIDAIVGGQVDVAREFQDRLLPVIDRAIFRVVGGRSARHADLVQTSFEQILETLFRNRFARACSLSTWGARIAARVALQELRDRARDRRRYGSSEPEQAPAPSDTERQAEVRTQLRRVQAQLVAMKPRRAEVIVLHDFEGYELSEIATMMGISVQSAQSLLVRARHQLIRAHERDIARARLRTR